MFSVCASNFRVLICNWLRFAAVLHRKPQFMGHTLPVTSSGKLPWSISSNATPGLSQLPWKSAVKDLTSFFWDIIISSSCVSSPRSSSYCHAPLLLIDPTLPIFTQPNPTVTQQSLRCERNMFFIYKLTMSVVSVSYISQWHLQL